MAVEQERTFCTRHRRSKAMKVHETRSHSRASSEEGRNLDKGKQKEEKDADQQQQQQQQASKSKKPKVEGENGESASKISQEFQEFCKATRKHLSIEEMRRILEANEQDASGSEDAVVPRCQDMMFYGALEKCPICRGQIYSTSSNYECGGAYSEWTTCTYTTMNAPRKGQPISIPDEISDNPIKEWMKRQESAGYPRRELSSAYKPLAGFVISLSGRLSRTHQAYREEIQKNGGRVSHDVNEIHCLVVSPAERERGGSVRVADAMERGIPVVSEKWLIDSIEKKQSQALDAYDVVSDLAPEGRGIPWDKMDPGEEAIESLTAEIKLHGKRCVHRDSRLREQGGTVFETDGVVYSCAFSQYDHGRGNNEYCILQLVHVPGKNVHLYYKEGRAGEDPMADESIEEWNSIGDAVREFTRLFELFTGNEFELWEREKKFQKKKLKFYPVDMGDGIDVRHGGLGLRQLGVAVAHCELEPLVANLMKVLCSQEIYRYALMEMGYDTPELPMGMLTDLHLKRCEAELLKFREKIEKASTSEVEAHLLWDDFSSKWFTLMHSTRPFGLRSYRDLADHVAAGLEGIRDVNVASRLVEDASTVVDDDPLSDRYRKLGCSITPVEKGEEAYKMIVKYLEATYEPVKVGEVVYGVSVENIFCIQSSAGPSYEEIKRLPNKILLWCGTRTANLLRHLQRGLLPAVCQIPVPGYMFGRAIVCSDASAEAARYGYAAADRTEGFLLLSIVSLGERMIEISTVPEVSVNKKLEEEKVSVKGLGKKRPDESEHFWWDADVKVPCGRLVASEHRDSPLEYNEYAVYDPKQVCMRFVVAVKYEEQKVEVVDAA